MNSKKFFRDSSMAKLRCKSPRSVRLFVGTTNHLAGELFKMLTGVNMLHVPYRGLTSALTDLLAGQVQVMFGGVLSSIEYVKAGQLRALAVTGATRMDILPEIPAVSDFVPGYEASAFYGVGAPKRTPSRSSAHSTMKSTRRLPVR
jgi:tripartite-type tricarboxylate transporter receptor subunit TctC